MLINMRRRKNAELLWKSQIMGNDIKRNKEISRQAEIIQKILSGGQVSL